MGGATSTPSTYTPPPTPTQTTQFDPSHTESQGYTGDHTYGGEVSEKSNSLLRTMVILLLAAGLAYGAYKLMKPKFEKV